jgi:hypothetical protein
MHTSDKQPSFAPATSAAQPQALSNARPDLPLPLPKWFCFRHSPVTQGERERLICYVQCPSSTENALMRPDLCAASQFSSVHRTLVPRRAVCAAFPAHDGIAQRYADRTLAYAMSQET